MVKSTNSAKTRPRDASVDDFIAAVPDPAQRADALAIAGMMGRLTGESPTMWGPTIIGYGRYHYRYESGREGEMCRIGFSPRKGQTVIYVVDGYDDKQALLDRLGKHKTGKACLYIKRLADVDAAVLEEICARSLAVMAEKYPQG